MEARMYEIMSFHLTACDWDSVWLEMRYACLFTQPRARIFH